MSSEPSRGRDGAPLTKKLLTAIAQHLNSDHAEDLLAVARAANMHWAEQAKVTHLEASGIKLEVRGNGQVQPIRVDFPAPATGVLAFKRLLGDAIAASRTQLGWAPAEDTQ